MKACVTLDIKHFPVPQSVQVETFPMPPVLSYPASPTAPGAPQFFTVPLAQLTPGDLQTLCDFFEHEVFAFAKKSPPPRPVQELAGSGPARDAVDRLYKVLTGPDDRACIGGSPGDNQIIETSLLTLKTYFSRP